MLEETKGLINDDFRPIPKRGAVILGLVLV
jgi:hypothetical protein